MRHELPKTRVAHPVLSSWSTSAHGSPAVTSTRELAALGAHLVECDLLRGRLFAVRMLGDAIRSFAAPRFVSVTALIIVALALTSWVV